MNATIMRNVPFEANGIKCLIVKAEFSTLRNIHIEVRVNHRVGQSVNVENNHFWFKCPDYTRNYGMFYCNVDVTGFHKYADGHDLYEFIQSTFKPFVHVKLSDEVRASKELLIIYSV